MNRIKVLQLITSLGAGGAERLLLTMMSHFDRERFDVRIATLADDLTGLKVYDYSPAPGDLQNASSDLIGTLTSLHRFYRDFKPDVVHAHMLHPMIASLVLARLFPNPAPLCFTSHCYDRAFPGARKLLVKASRRLRAIDIIFSEGQHPELNANRTQVIPNGVEVSPSRHERKPWTSDGPVRLLAVGRITDQKDPLGMIRSLANIERENVTLDFVGAGPLEASAKELVESMGISDRVRFHGVRSDIRRVMRESDVFVMHSKYEGMPMVLLEAGAEAMPVVATPVGSIPSILGCDRGIVTEPSQFSASLRAVLNDPGRAIQMGLCLHQHVLKHHSIQGTTERHQALYELLARGHASSDSSSPP